MNWNEAFKMKAPDHETDSVIEQLATKILGVLPVDTEGQILWRETGVLLSEKLMELYKEAGIEASSPDVAMNATIGLLVTVGKFVLENKDRVLGQNKSKFNMVLGLAEGFGLPAKLVRFLLQRGFKE